MGKVKGIKYYSGRFFPKHPEKYVGDANNIIFRSSWELKLMKWLDENPNILKYSSEELIIPYISPVDGERHRYFPDFLIEYIDKKGDIKRAVLEVKPQAQTVPPKRKTKEAVIRYAINQSKWAAAEKFAERNNMQFLLITEQHLGIK